MTIKINDTGFPSLVKMLSKQVLAGMGSAVIIFINGAMIYCMKEAKCALVTLMDLRLSNLIQE